SWKVCPTCSSLAPQCRCNINSKKEEVERRREINKTIMEANSIKIIDAIVERYICPSCYDACFGNLCNLCSAKWTKDLF
ncbi:hypothetical protein HN865_03645, partial [Candidatus Woesearchaeota archaeon]|nr:hypothetical protein [Candidatus Woesearchaeota archaeon]